MKKILLITILALTQCLSFGADTINVGVNVAAPFVEKTENGYSGVSIKLFEEYIKDTGLVVNYSEFDVTDNLIKSIESGQVDIGIGAITITPERYGSVDFTQPYYRSSISLAYDPDESYSTWDAITSFFTIDLFYGILMLCIYLWSAGVIFWFIERKENENFPSIFIGAYFAFMILSTVGFGDIAPKTKQGKALVMFFGTICLIVSGFFLANIASSFTLNKLESEIKVENLNKKKVGTLIGCTSSSFLDDHNIRYIGFKSVEEGLDAIKTGELDVFVYDTPVLQYMINKKNLSDVVALSEKAYEPQFYGFPISKGSDIDDKINPVIVKYTNVSDWKNVLYQYNLEQ